MARKVLKKIGVQVEDQKPAAQNRTQKSDSVSRIKLSFDGEPQFFINTKNKTVTCKIRSHINYPLELRLLNVYSFYKNNGIFTSVGVAKLHEGDEWNEELGRRIAEAKAKRHAYAAGFNYANSILTDSIRDLRSVVELRDSMKSLREHEVEHFNELLESVEA